MFLSLSCRKARTCVCTILQPNIAADTTKVVIDNTEVKAFSICTSKDLMVTNTATTTCVIVEN